MSPNKRGKLYAIEGGDGSGKATQAELTRKYASEVLGKQVMKRSFPRYGQDSAWLVERYLNGEFGDIDAVPPEFVSLAFAVDRLAGTPEIDNHLSKGSNHIVILDRYVGSNIAHQGAKFTNLNERLEFYRRLQRIEFDDLGMLQPDKNIVLIVPPEVSHQNVAKKDKRDYTEKSHDIHEADTEYQERVKLAYEELCELFPDRYQAVMCTDASGSMRTRDEIQVDIRNLLALT